MQNVLFIVNVQHDCITCKCTASGTRVVQQERQDSEVRVAAWAHTAVQRYVLNTHAIHNALQLRELLPRTLTYPTAIWTDREKELAACAGTALLKYVRKEMDRKTKAAQTRKRNQDKRQQEKEQHGVQLMEQGQEDLYTDEDEDGAESKDDDTVDAEDALRLLKRQRRRE